MLNQVMVHEAISNDRVIQVRQKFTSTQSLDCARYEEDDVVCSRVVGRRRSLSSVKKWKMRQKKRSLKFKSGRED